MYEPALSSFFKVELTDNVGVMGEDASGGVYGEFERVSGLGVEFEYESYLEGGAVVPVQFYKNATAQSLTLERGTITEADLFSKWMDMISLGICVKLSGKVTLCDARGKALREWIIKNAYPVKYVGPPLDSSQTSAAVSLIEFVYGGAT